MDGIAGNAFSVNGSNAATNGGVVGQLPVTTGTVTEGTPTCHQTPAARLHGLAGTECSSGDSHEAKHLVTRIALRLADVLEREHTQHQHAIARVLEKVAAIASLCDMLTSETHDLRRDPRVSRAQRDRSQSVVDAVQAMVVDILHEHGCTRMSVAPGDRVDLTRHEVIDRVPSRVVTPGCIDRIHQLGFETRSGAVLSKSLVTAAVGHQR